ncbi:hypothetical protein LTR10_002163 [Elasticomyces elasticus]|nr:hypothetical protein LTR10_002163 [Elasticomyces elasticus]KAK4973763.1 hypothetical protein LTR42_005752 [Elasticomyces elasticus]
MAMEPPPMFRLSPHKLQSTHTFSPERASRTVSTVTTATKTSYTTDSDADFFPPPRELSSTHSSPTRRANLFSEYGPATPKQTATGFGLPQSPSLPEIHALRSHVRTNSDVHGLVKRFEHLDVRDKDVESSERRKKHEAELRRAQIAREEAESDVRRLREELRQMKKESEESRERERRAGSQFEKVMADLNSAKEQYAAKHAAHHKEFSRAKKEIFKASSAYIKLQEELKATRNTLRVTQSGLDAEKHKMGVKEQETFSAQYHFAEAQEELDKLRAHLRIVEEEKEILKKNLKEDELSKIAADGKIALPTSVGDDDLAASPSKRSPLSDDKENMGVVPKKVLDNKRLQEELVREQMRRERAEEMIEFLGLECMFRCCRCRSGSEQENHQRLGAMISGELGQQLDSVMGSMKAVLVQHEETAEVVEVQSGPVEHEDAMEVEPTNGADNGAATEEQSPQQPEHPAEQETDRSMTMTAEDEPLAPRPTPAEPEVEGSPEIDETEPLHCSTPPQTPAPTHQRTHPPMLRTITTTTTIPIQFTPISKPMQYNPEDAENIPPRPDSAADSSSEHVVDRAAALAAIEYRRGRAKSFQAGHLTPRKQMLEGVNVSQRRDISAPALGGKIGGTASYAKGAGSVGRAGRRMV